MDRRATTAIAIGALIAMAFGLWVWLGTQEDDAETETIELEGGESAEDGERAEAWQALERESRELMPELLDGLALGMPIERVQQLRPRAQRNAATASNPQTPGLTFLEEDLRGGARAVYGFEVDSRRLQRVQILSLLPTQDAIAPHLAAMNERYGSPTGIWTCPNTGGVPTRRFTWRHGRTTISDIFLVYGGRVSQTLYIAPSGVALVSLRRAGCRPVQNREEAQTFPVTTPEQMMDSER